MTNEPPWTILFKRRGFQVKLARQCGVTPQRVNGWRNGIPVEFCVDVERACGGEFTRLDFRPDDGAQIWPEFAQRQKRAAKPATVE